MSDADNIEAPKDPVTDGVDSAGVKAKPSGAQRIVHILVAVLVAVVLPVLVIGAIIGEFAAGAMFVGLLFGVVGSKIGGTRRMLYVAPVMGVAAGLGAFTAYDW
jgi:hypothetical protein